MALTNYERQKRWREKNRVIYNLRRRNARKGFRSNPEYAKASHEVEVYGADPKHPTIAELRELIRTPLPVPVEAAVKPRIFKSDTGAVISEEEWNAWQQRKRCAQERGFEIDEYSQA